MKSFFDAIKNNKAVRDFLDEYGPQLRKMTVICLLGLVIFAGYALVHDNNEPDLQVSERSAGGSGPAGSPVVSGDEAQLSDSTGTPLDGTIFVDIGGAVKTPMLAELPNGSRVDDAIEAAGGLRKEADMTNINRAEFLVDGQKVFIPSYALDEDGNIIESSAAGSVPDSGTSSATGAIDPSGKVNINTADSTQLQTLNGVGPATAQKIIDYRDSSGRFTTIEDLKNVSGIGDKTFEKLKDYICV